MTTVVNTDRRGWLRAIWQRLDQAPGDTPDDVALAMAWIAETLGVDPADPALHE